MQRLIDLALFLTGMGWLAFWGSRPSRRKPCNLCGTRPHAAGCVTQHAQGFGLR